MGIREEIELGSLESVFREREQSEPTAVLMLNFQFKLRTLVGVKNDNPY